MLTNQQQLDRLEANSLAALAAVILAALTAAAFFMASAASALASGLPLVVR
jgi:hypothetical protein